MYPNRDLGAIGGLMSYGADVATVYRRLGKDYVALILKGQKPADIPIQLPTKFALTINLKTANALGLEIPPTLLALADEVME
jgi:putative tryptophan/tyrosine transport system substrate-binding protein